tara:strand:- start:40 stop:198 length:159 start_codon:yes stop_codon:yes gene_type:complete
MTYIAKINILKIYINRSVEEIMDLKSNSNMDIKVIKQKKASSKAGRIINRQM